MSDVDWIEELKVNAPDSERAFLKEVLCFLKRCPISEEFQNTLDTDFPATRGLLEEQVKIGMKDAWRCSDWHENDEVFGVVGGDYDIGWMLINEVFQTGFYWLDTTMNGHQHYYALFYYDNESEEAVFIHNTGGRNQYEDDYFETTLKYRLTSGDDASIYLPRWIEENYDSLENDEDVRSLTLNYLGRKCEAKENDSPLGLFNWL